MPFVKGQSGNPNGRRPSPQRLELENLLNRNWPLADREAALQNLVTMAKTDLEALKLLLAYTYGKPIDRKEISGPDGEPLKAYVSVNPDDWDNQADTSD